MEIVPIISCGDEASLCWLAAEQAAFPQAPRSPPSTPNLILKAFASLRYIAPRLYAAKTPRVFPWRGPLCIFRKTGIRYLIPFGGVKGFDSGTPLFAGTPRILVTGSTSIHGWPVRIGNMFT